MSAHSCFPDDELATLGPPEQVHPASAIIQWLCWLTAVGAFAVAGFCLVCAAVPFGKDPPPSGVLVAVGAGFTLGGVTLIGLALWYRSLTYVVFRDGVAKLHRGQCTFLRWDDIDAIWEGLAPRSIHWWITTKAGQKIHINYVTKHVDALGRALQAKMTQHLFASALKTIEAGGPVSFGPLEISQSFLGFKARHLPWSEIKKVSLEWIPKLGAQLWVYKKGKVLPWCAVRAVEIPNLGLFRKLLDRVRPEDLNYSEKV